MHRASDTYLLLSIQFPYLIEITHSSSYLVFHFNEGIFLLQIELPILQTLLLNEGMVHTHSLCHHLPYSIDGVIVDRLGIMGCLVNCHVVKHVVFITLIDEYFVLVLLYYHVP